MAWIINANDKSRVRLGLRIVNRSIGNAGNGCKQCAMKQVDAATELLYIPIGNKLTSERSISVIVELGPLGYV